MECRIAYVLVILQLLIWDYRIYRFGSTDIRSIRINDNIVVAGRLGFALLNPTYLTAKGIFI